MNCALGELIGPPLIYYSVGARSLYIDFYDGLGESSFNNSKLNNGRLNIE